MQTRIKKDIFISYKNDGSGNQFASRLYLDLYHNRYSVFFNSEENRGDDFQERLETAIRDCKDFILVLSQGCLDQLKRNEDVDWVRTEILLARKYKKHIIPILIEGTKMPKDPREMPEELRFLPLIDALHFPEQYMTSPFLELQKAVISRQDGLDPYKDAFNSNPAYDISGDYLQILEKAKEGDVEAMYQIGMLDFYGAASGTPEQAGWNYEQAYYWLKKVSQSDSELRFHADNTLGRMYYQGQVPREPQSYEKAFQCQARASEKDEFARRERAFLMRIGVGCKFDFDATVEYLREIEDTADDEYKRMLALFLTNYGRYKEALEVYDSMENLSPETEYQLGMLYLRGAASDPPKPDYVRAAFHFRNAADNNHLAAANEYATMCMRPPGRFKKNFKEAEKYFKIAADGGNSVAQYMLGYMYRTGLAERNLEKAIRYFEKAKEQNNSGAALELASIYQQPGYQNYGRAYSCAELAASHGMAEGALILGNLLFWGRGCEADMDKAYEMYRIANERGMFFAGVMMEKIRAITGIDY